MLRCLDCMQADIDKHHRCSTCGSSAIGEVFEVPLPLLLRETYDAATWKRFRDFFKTTNNWGIPINRNNKQGE